jgi:histidinol-phosphate aminotransferase
MNSNTMIRPEVKNLEPYLPGKPIPEVQRELGLKKIVKLASNENALGASKRAIQAIGKQAPQCHRYPEGRGTLLRQAIAQRWQVKETQVILGAGSDEIIELLGKAFFNPQDEIIISEHAFTRYKMTADLMGTKTVVVPMKNFKHYLVGMAQKVNRKTKAIFIANPNNPTGTYVNDGEVKTFLSLIQKKGLKPFIVFDEAYYEYAKAQSTDYPETLDYFKKGFPLVILRTFSKVHGLAGLRIGYGILPEAMVNVLDRVRAPFNVSSVAQAAAIAALEDQRHVQRSVQLVNQQMNRFIWEFDQLGLQYIPSVGNFFLVEVSPHKGQEIFERLLRRGVIVRAMAEYGFENYIRVTIGLPEENTFFIRQLKEVL